LKTYTVKLIEGKTNNLIWQKANSLIDFSSPWDSEFIKKTEFKAVHNSEYIFLQFKVNDHQTHIHASEDKNDSINNSDRVELFFRCDASLTPYYCLEIDSKSRIMDFKSLPNKDFNFNWNWPLKDIDVKSSVKQSHYIIEIKISIKSLNNLNLIKKGVIETGIYRAKYKKQEDNTFKPTWITWVNPGTDKPNFHTPTSFGILKLE